MRLAATASCREASVTLAPLRTKVLRPRPANVRDDMSPNGLGTHCRLPTKPEALGEGVASATANLGLPRHVAGWLAASEMKGLESGLFFPGDFLEISWRPQPQGGSSLV